MSLHLIDPERPASDTDVEKCYRLFLARKAATGTDVTEKAGLPLLSIIASMLASDEFNARMGLVDGILVVDEAMLVELEPDLLEWVEYIAGPITRTDDAPLDRWTVIDGLLDDDSVWGVLKAQDTRDSDALKAAIIQARHAARVVRGSPLFDQDHYRAQLSIGARIARLADHYVLVGEREGLQASATFTAAAYAEQNSDVAASSFSRLAHYEEFGRAEGRLHRDWLIDHTMPPLDRNSSKPTILLLLHEASYTGAPILGWNLVRALSDRCDVVVVLRRGGALEAALRESAAAVVAAPPHERASDPQEMARFAGQLKAVYAPLYVIANSVETRSLGIALRQHAVPVVALIHEFWPGATPGLRLDFYAACAALVFPARIVERSSFDAFREIGLQNRFILPQGPCAIPPFASGHVPRPFGAPFGNDMDTPVSLDSLLTDDTRGDGPFTVIGLGAVEMRKGIDLFVAAATAMKAKHPDIPCRFIWIGTWEHAIGSQYAALVAEQVARSGLGDRLYFFPAVDDLAPVYDRADALFLSSRLDPLPNITIDAAFRGIPVICFDQASGTAEMLATDTRTATLVVPHLDSGAAADRIAALARDKQSRDRCGDAMRDLAQRSFNLASYAQALDRIGRAAAGKAENAEHDRQLIDDAQALDATLYFGPDRDDVPDAENAAMTYIDDTKHLNFASPPVFGVILRRPQAGFHPFIYAMEAPGFPRDGSRDPLAHYVEHGMPSGRWAHRVLRPDRAVAASASDDADGRATTDASAGRIALHGHFHYPDTINDFMTALAANRLRADLFLTTTSDAAADRLRTATADYGNGDVVVEVGPNVGRDIYAFLQVLRTHLHGRYEFVGHLHGKHSVHTQDRDPTFGGRWRHFLWDHLLGPDYAAADTIIAAMQRDPTLGLVFPENGYLVGWEKNDDSARVLARRIELRKTLPGHIEFPAGTMFWARVAALDTLVRADFRQAEMPVEPLPIDGTILHAFERMLPLVCEEAGYGYATSYIPHLGR